MKINFFSSITSLMLICLPVLSFAQDTNFTIKEVRFESKGIVLAGSVLLPRHPVAAVVVVHGSDPVKREMAFARRLAAAGIAVLTYDKRGVGASGGVYVGPSVGTNNVDTGNLSLLAHDANAAANQLRTHLQHNNLPMGLVGFSQAGWIIPIAASRNPHIAFMILFSGPTITTLEQLRFQFYTNGDNHFWDNHTDADARQHTINDPDKYAFAPTDPKPYLQKLSIPGLWLFGEKDIQMPVKLCIDQLNALKAKGKPYQYALFPALGHNTASDSDNTPVDIAVQWMKRHQLTFGQQKPGLSDTLKLKERKMNIRVVTRNDNTFYMRTRHHAYSKFEIGFFEKKEDVLKLRIFDSVQVDIKEEMFCLCRVS